MIRDEGYVNEKGRCRVTLIPPWVGWLSTAFVMANTDIKDENKDVAQRAFQKGIEDSKWTLVVRKGFDPHEEQK